MRTWDYFERSQTYARAWRMYGHDAQLRMLAEECSELAVAALHVVRGRKDGKGQWSNLAEELADVSNMVEQIVWALNLSDEVSHIRNVKLERLDEDFLRRREEEGKP